jgi:predicted Zn-dependent protease
VLAHETGHITARHSAERYSQGVLTSLGAAVISAAVDSSGVTQALNVGSNLYLSSYSRGQEEQADFLGLRYMNRGGYDPAQMASFLSAMEQESALENKSKGQAFNYFSTHPATAERVNATLHEARAYPPGGSVDGEKYLNIIDGMVYGDNTKQGFARGNAFYHPEIGFTFSVPDGFKITNNPDQVVAASPGGAVILFDMAGNPDNVSPAEYIRGTWVKAGNLASVEEIMVNGMKGATSGFEGSVNGQPASIRLVAIEWKGGFARFQIAMPKNASPQFVEDLKRSTHSFRALNAKEKTSLRPARVKIVTAKAGDSVASLAAKQPFGAQNEEKVRVLNSLASTEVIQSGRRYKIVTD